MDGLNKLVLWSCAFCGTMVMSIQFATTVSESQAIPFQGKMNHTPVDPCQWMVSVILNEVCIALESYFMVSKEINSQAYSLWQWQKKRTIRALSKGTLGSWFQAVLSDGRVLPSFLMFYLVGIKGSLYEHGCVFEKEMISSWVKKRTVPSSSDQSNVSRKTVFVCQLPIETSKKSAFKPSL